MDKLRYIVKRILLALLILFGVSVIIFGLSRMMPTDFVDDKYSSAVNQGLMQQEDIDRIKEIYGLYMPDAYLSMKFDDTHDFGGKKFTKNTKKDTYERVEAGSVSQAEFYAGSYNWKGYRIVLATKSVDQTEIIVDKNGNEIEVVSQVQVPDTYELWEVHEGMTETKDPDASDDSDDDDGNLIIIDKSGNILKESGTWEIKDGNVSLSVDGKDFSLAVKYRVASFGDKLGTLLSSYFNWLGNMFKGDLGISFKYQRPVGSVIVENMGISFGIAFVATILEFLIAIPLGIKAATHQYGVVDYTVTVLTMIGISLPTFFMAAIMIRIFSVGLGIFPINGLVTPDLPTGTSGIVVFGDMLWHLILPMFVLVVLSIGSLMRYTRTNTLEVLNADYIRTARAKGLSEKSVIYKHAFRNTMIPIVTLMAGILPTLFSGAMITEQVFAIPGIGQKAYQALLSADVPFIMGYNMFIAILTVVGTLLSDIMYAVVDPRVKLK